MTGDESRRFVPASMTFGQPATAGDAAAIDRLMANFNEAWAKQDVAGVLAAYAPDAEWTNAFGTVARGHDELDDFLSALFARFPASTGAEESARGQRVSIRYLGDEVAVIHNVTESSRGSSRTGRSVRHVHITYVLHRGDAGWRIAHQMIMDARE